jgi:hypothetical protein
MYRKGYLEVYFINILLEVQEKIISSRGYHVIY